MIWILTICTQSWLLCGQVITREYQSEQQCYRAMDELYARQGASGFKFVTCAPKSAKEPHNE